MKNQENKNISVSGSDFRIKSRKEQWMKTSMKKRNFTFLFAVLFSALFFVSIFTGASGSGGETPVDKSCRLAPLNPGFLKYIDARSIDRGPRLHDRAAATGGYPLGGVPSPVDLSHIRGPVDNTVNAEYPAYYDLRALGLVTPMKNQANYPTCWIFAAFASLESCLLPDQTVDFSEWHMAISHGFDYTVQDAGNSFMTTAYLTRWSGPVDETEVTYGSVSYVSRYIAPAKHVQQVVYLPQREGPLDNNTVKYFVMNYGPVDFAYNWEFGNFNDSTNSMYTPNNGGENHRLTVVGWDDDYPAGRFTYRPAGNGAFICRNSWGDVWGERGYCYISYYDLSFVNFTSFNNAEEPVNYGTIYQYDPLGHTRTWGKQESWGANVFIAESSEALESVGFYAVDAGMNYEIHIYKNIDAAANNPTSGTLTAVKTGTFVYAGYYTVKLDNPVPLEQGERFSIVVKFKSSTYRYSVPIEAPLARHSSGASANPGESYVSEDGLQWNDLTTVVPGSNVCIKAYSEYKESNVSLEATRKTLKGWLVTRDYADIVVTVSNLDEVPLSKLILYRSLNSPGFDVLLEISPDELVNGRFFYQDKYLERTESCTYQVVAVDMKGLISSKSGMVTL